MAKIVPQGAAVIRAHLEHLLGHGERDLYRQAVDYLTGEGIPVPEHETVGGRAGVTGTAPAGCPGSAVRNIEA